MRPDSYRPVNTVTPARGRSSLDHVPSHIATNHGAAWAFVLQHATLIERMSGRFFDQLKSEDKEDARADLIALIVDRYDGSKIASARDPYAMAVCWIGFQCRRIQKTYTRRFRRETREGIGATTASGVDVLSLMPAEGYGSHDDVEANVARLEAEEVAQRIYAEATPKQREAMMTILLEMSSDEMRAAFGITPNVRNDRIKTLRERHAATTV
jgi:hypothetical protein